MFALASTRPASGVYLQLKTLSEQEKNVQIKHFYSENCRKPVKFVTRARSHKSILFFTVRNTSFSIVRPPWFRNTPWLPAQTVILNVNVLHIAIGYSLLEVTKKNLENMVFISTRTIFILKSQFEGLACLKNHSV